MKSSDGLAVATRAGALACLVTLVACGRIDPQEELRQANASYDAGDYRAASIHLGNTLQADPSNPEARLLRGRIALLVGDADLAAAEIERAQSLGAPLEAVAIDLAAARAAVGDTERALVVLDEARAAHEGTARYWTIRGRVLAGLGRIAEAHDAYQISEAIGPQTAENLVGLADLALTRNAPEEARALLDEAIRLAPDDPDPLRARAALALRFGRLDEAVGDLVAAADGYSERPPSAQEAATLFMLAQVHLASDRSSEAAAVAQRLAARVPGAAIGEFAQAIIAYEDGRLDAALDLMRSVLQKEPGNPRYLVVMGALQLAMDNVGQAEQNLMNAIAAAPDDYAAVRLLAETRLRQQRPGAALESLALLSDEAANDAQARVLAGLANFQAGDFSTAVQNFERAVALDPANQTYRLQLARAYLAVQRTDDALALLQGSVVAADGDSALAGQFLELVAYVQGGEIESGKARAAALLAERPNDAEALTAVAVFNQLIGDRVAAFDGLADAVRADDEYAPARMLLAEMLLQEGRAEEAENHLREAAGAGDGYAPAMTALAQRLAARGAFDEAEQLLRDSIERSPALGTRLVLARIQMLRGEFEEAEAQIAVAERMAPGSAEVLAARGLLALASGRPADAVRLLEQSHDAMPARIDIVLALSQAQWASGEVRTARDTLSDAQVVAPQSRQLKAALGAAELAIGNRAEAARIADDLKVSFPTAPAGPLLEGEVLMAQGNAGEAAESFAAAYDRQPSWPHLQRLVGALQSASRTDEARSRVEAWIQREPRHVEARLTLGALLIEAGRPAEALAQYRNVLELNRNNFAALNDAAWLANELEEPDALSLAERAHALAPENPAVMDTLAWIHITQNREQSAIGLLERAAELAPQAPEIQYHLAVAQSRLGRRDAARATLSALLDRGVPFASRDAAADLLESL